MSNSIELLLLLILAVDFTPRERQLIATHARPRVLPADSTNPVADDPNAVRLGQALFFETALSPDQQFSCATCHDPAQAFSDGRPLPITRAPLTNPRHTPTLLNIAYQRWYFWDGRADTLWGQALEPMEHPAEMGSSRTRIVQWLTASPRYRALYENTFGSLPPAERFAGLPSDARPPLPGEKQRPQHQSWRELDEAFRAEVTAIFVRLGWSIAAYERRLTTADSAFDRFARDLNESDNTLSAAAQRGLAIFIGRGQCRSCHAGPHFSDLEFHDTRIEPRDPGRYQGIEKFLAGEFTSAGPHSADPHGARARLARRLKRPPRTHGELRTPTLRNIADTPPYMHRGQLPDLEAVVHFYNTLEGARPPHHGGESILKPLGLTARDEADLVAFLRSLTDQTRPAAALLAPPAVDDPSPVR